MLPSQPRHPRGGRFVWIQLDRRTPEVMDRFKRIEDRFEIYDTFAGRQVLMHSVFPDVFKVDVSDVIQSEFSNDLCGIVANAEKVSDVTVHADQRFIWKESLLESEILFRGFDEQSRFRFDREDDVMLPCGGEDLLNSFREGASGLIARH